MAFTVVVFVSSSFHVRSQNKFMCRGFVLFVRNSSPRLTRLSWQMCAPKHAPALKTDRIVEESQSVVKHHIIFFKAGGSSRGLRKPHSCAAKYGSKRKFVEVIVQRRDL